MCHPCHLNNEIADFTQTHSHSLVLNLFTVKRFMVMLCEIIGLECILHSLLDPLEQREVFARPSTLHYIDYHPSSH
jgi:hypothetical protein